MCVQVEDGLRVSCSGFANFHCYAKMAALEETANVSNEPAAIAGWLDLIARNIQSQSRVQHPFTVTFALLYCG